MNVNEGGPAFPNSRYGDQGMSLRDYFAAQTMPALIGLAVAHAQTATTEILKSSKLARAAYEVADALLAERAK